MPRTPARLANCYVPLPVKKTDKMEDGMPTDQSQRGDRGEQELRRLCLETGVLERQALGSSLVECGHTKVLCRVSITTSHPDALLDTGILECKVRFAPHIGLEEARLRSKAVSPLDSEVHAGRLHSEVISTETSLSSKLHSALESAVLLDRLPKAAVLVHATILQDDGSALSACITAASLALADARVEAVDLVASCTVAVRLPPQNQEEEPPTYLADPTEAETSGASAILCLAMTPNLKEVTLWSQSGRLNAAQANEAIRICRTGCRTMHRFMREVWIGEAT